MFYRSDSIRDRLDCRYWLRRASPILVAPLLLAAAGPTAAVELKPKDNDVGLALHIIDRAGDKNDDGESMSFRFFEGASIYYSLGRGERRLKWVATLSALDFFDDVDLETGVALGLLFKPKGATKEDGGDEDGRFTISVVRGYNLMTDGSANGEYTLVGFGWNFNFQQNDN